jgi:hypothetical protein
VLGNTSGANSGDQTISITGDVTAAGGAGALTATVTKINGTTLSGLATGILKNTTGTGVPSIAVAGDLPGGPYVTAAIVPNTAPSAGQLLVGNAGGTAYAPVAASGDVAVASTGATTIQGGVVTNAKLATVGAYTLKGNNTASTAAPADIAVSSAAIAALSNLSGTNTGNETATTIKTALGITTLSGSNTGDQTLSGLGGVPTSRTVNGHALTGDISITASDVGADVSGAASSALTTAEGYADSAVSTHNALALAAHGGIAPNYLMSTGLVSGGTLSVNTDTTKFNILAGTAPVVNTYTTPTSPTVTPLTWATKTAIADTYLSTTDITYIGLDASGNVVQSPTIFTTDQLRDIVFLGATGHPYRTFISYASSTPSIAYEPAKTLEDFLRAFGEFCADGNVYYPLGGLYLGKSAGATFATGQNYAINRKSPNITLNGAQSSPGQCVILYSRRDGSGGWVNSDFAVTVDPNHYDDGSGTLASVPAGKFTIQCAFYFSEPDLNFTGMQYGQVIYDTLALAKAAVQEGIAINPSTSAALFRSWLIVQQGQTTLTSANFVAAGKFGMSSVMSTGVGGETNTASNIGTAGVGLYAQKLGADLEFKNLNSSTGKITIADSPSDHTVNLGVSLSASDVGMGNVTNDAQTKAAIVPNTAPSAGQMLIGNAGGTAYAPVAASGDVAVASTGAMTIQGAVVTNAKLATVGAYTLKGNNTASTAAPADIALSSANLTGLAALSGTNTGNETATTIKTALGITTLSGSNTGDQTISITGDVTAAGSAGALTSTVTKINGTALSGLATGILKNTTSTGVPSIAVAGDLPGGPYVTQATTVNGHALSGNVAVTTTDLSLNNLTNDAQTKAAIVPNTAPSAGQMLIGNAGGTAYAPVAASGDVTVASTGAHTIANAAVTNAKLATVGAYTLKGNNTASTAAPADIALSSANLTALAALTGTNTGNETATTIKTALGITTLSGSNTGDQTISITGDVTAAGGTGALSATVTKINGTALSGLGTGLLKNTTSTGVPSIAVAGDLPGGPYVTQATTVNGHALSGNVAVTTTDLSLNNLTNDAQTKAAIVPNTAPSAGQLLVGNAGGTAYAPVAASGDVTVASTGAMTIQGAVVTNAKLATVGAYTLKGNNTASTAAPADIALSSANLTGLAALSGSNTGDQTISITGDVTAAGSAGALSATVTKLNGTSLAGLATGILKNTTSTGVPSIVVSGTDIKTINGTSLLGSGDIVITGSGSTPTGTGWRHVTSGVEDAAATTPTATQVGLGNVTNDAQTKAAIVPNTAPSAGQILVGNTGNTAFAPVTLSGDGTMASTGSLSITKLNGTSLSGLATGLLKNTTGTGIPSIAAAGDLPGGPYVTQATTVNGHALSGNVSVTTTDLSLNNLTNDAQTKAAIVPNTAPSAGQLLVGNAGGTAYAPVAASGDVTVASTGATTIQSGVVTNAKLATVGAYTLKGNNTASTAAPADIALSSANLTGLAALSGTNTGNETATTIKTALGITTLSGSNTGDQTISITGDVTASGGTGALSATVTKINGTTLSGLATGILKNTTTTGVPSIATGADLPSMSATVGGAVPTPPNNTTTFLRGDGTFASPPSGGTPPTGTGYRRIVSGTEDAAARPYASVATDLLVQPRGTQTVVSSASLVTLTATSPRQLVITGSGANATQTVQLPNATTLPFADWGCEIVNQSAFPANITFNDATTYAIIPAGFDLTINCTSIATTNGTWQSVLPWQAVLQNPSACELLVGLEAWGHSYLDCFSVGSSVTNVLTNSNAGILGILSTALGMPTDRVINHAVTGSELAKPVRAAGINAGGGFAKMLSEIVKTKQPFYPFEANGNAHLIFTGLNDIGNNTAGNQSLLQTTSLEILSTSVSLMRSSCIIDGNNTTLITYSGTWAAAAAAASDYTSSRAWATSTTGGTFTYRIPTGYQGEPINISMVGFVSTNACSVTFSGTAGVTGTTTLNSRGIAAQCMVSKRITALTAANAGDTIVGTVSVSTATFILNAINIESLQPPPVIIFNHPTLPERTINIPSAIGVTTGATTAFTDAAINFLTLTDAGATLLETDAQGAFTGNTNTVSSVTNPTTIVMGTAAASAKTGIHYTLARRTRGYSSGLLWTTNTNFTGATVANHTAADADITNWNANVIAACKARFDDMVQVANVNAAIGSDNNLPSNVYSWFDEVSFAHPNALGNQMIAWAGLQAAAKLRQNTTSNILAGAMCMSGIPRYNRSSRRRLILSGSAGARYMPDDGELDVIGNLYTCVAGALFAFPYQITEAGTYAMSANVETVGTTGSSVLCAGLYDDMAGPNGEPYGYPQNMRIDMGAVTLTATAGIRSIGNIWYGLWPGLWWLVVGVKTLGTASTLRTMIGPSASLPQCLPASGTATILRPIGWKITGATLTSNCPPIFPAISGAALCGCGGGTFASASSAPYVDMLLNRF